MVASRKLTEDPRAEAEYGERVPYVITNGEGSRLVDRAMAPEELLNNRYVGCRNVSAFTHASHAVAGI